ncbi:hypothetical protein [Frankia sp. Cas3]|uniref:hypothetical protein n=1 Tax=Frankia sp. Cas3 TaxID=3073926 RepID=UPI002AD4A0BC|nr:hypothetical protein [Frankia sp. Cas3]
MTGGEHPGGMSPGDGYTITIHPADRPAEVLRAWAALPDGVGFAEAFGDVDVTLVFRPVAELASSWEPGETTSVPG